MTVSTKILFELCKTIEFSLQDYTFGDFSKPETEKFFGHEEQGVKVMQTFV